MDNKELANIAGVPGLTVEEKPVAESFPKPPERTYFRPIGHGIETNGAELHMGFLLSPLKFVQIEVPGQMAVELLGDMIEALKPGLTAEGKSELIAKLTGIVTVT
jgi:hypothetical protein